MNGALYAAAGALVGLLLCAVLLAVSLGRAAGFAADLVGGVGAISEALLAVSAKLQTLAVLVEAQQPGNSVGTKLAELETKVQQAQLVVADAVEKVTSLSARVQTRVQRAQARSLDDEEEADELSPEERRQALTALASAGLAQPGSEAGTAPRKPAGSGWDRVRRSAATQRKEA